jgi:hypothetical protein
MGMFEVNVELASLAAPGRTEKVSLLVDTGARHCPGFRATSWKVSAWPLSHACHSRWQMAGDFRRCEAKPAAAGCFSSKTKEKQILRFAQDDMMWVAC